MLPLTVIIATMNRTDALTETLESIRDSSTLPEEVLMVDQSTKPEIADAVRSMAGQYPFTMRYYHLERPSLTAARNFGLSHANNNTLVFMDDDVSVQKETFLKISQLMANKSMAMIAGLNLLDKKGNNRMGYFFGLKSRKKERQGGYVTPAMFGRFPRTVVSEMPTEWAMGYFFVVRKDLAHCFPLHVLRTGGLFAAVLLFPIAYGRIFRYIKKGFVQSIRIPEDQQDTVIKALGLVCVYYFSVSLFEGYPPLGPNASAFMLWLLIGLADRHCDEKLANSASLEGAV